MSGNTTLIEHGIQTDEGDYRFHVSFGVGKAYLFPTAAGREAVEKGMGREFSASQPGVSVVTGKGRKVPWQQIEGCIEIDIPQKWLDKLDCKKDDSTGLKGKKAVAVAKAMFLWGLVPLPVAAREITEKNIQIKGKDLIITSEWSVEVKCDFWGGENGLALQTHECNPLGIH